MDVFGLSRHEYLQPPVPKHGRQNQQSSGVGSSSAVSGSGNSGNNQSSGGSSIQAQQASFSTGLFGNMNQSSSS